MDDSITLHVRGDLTDRELDLLHAAAFDQPPAGAPWRQRLADRSLPCVTTQNVGFVAPKRSHVAVHEAGANVVEVLSAPRKSTIIQGDIDFHAASHRPSPAPASATEPHTGARREAVRARRHSSVHTSGARYLNYA